MKDVGATASATATARTPDLQLMDLSALMAAARTPSPQAQVDQKDTFVLNSSGKDYFRDDEDEEVGAIEDANVNLQNSKENQKAPAHRLVQTPPIVLYEVGGLENGIVCE